MYEDYKKYPNLPKLPDQLDQSLEKLKNNKKMNEAFGTNVIDSYVKLRGTEIEEFDNMWNMAVGVSRTWSSPFSYSEL